MCSGAMAVCGAKMSGQEAQWEMPEGGRARSV